MKWFNSQSDRRPTQTIRRTDAGRTNRGPLQLESLEAREVPAFVASWSPEDRILRLEGTESADSAVVMQRLGSVTVPGSTIQIKSGGTVVGSTGVLSVSKIAKVVANCYGGNDSVRIVTVPTSNPLVDQTSNRPIALDANGGFGKDTLTGNNYMGGNDTLDGGFGDDVLKGNAGTDTLRGSFGNDTLYGGAGGDTLQGSFDNDILYGGSGRDTLDGGFDNDILFGGANRDADTLRGGPDADLFLPISGEDASADVATEDARMRLTTNGTCNWTDANVERLVPGMSYLLNRTGNTRIFELAPTPKNLARGSLEVELQRVLSLGSGALADNNSESPTPGRIRFADSTFSPGRTSDVVFVHELAHNWDTESVFWGFWLDESGWVARPAGASPGPNQAISGDGKWFYDTRAVFYRDGDNGRDDYSMHNPREDWATTFEAYYLSTKGQLSSADQTRLDRKLDFIDSFLASMTT
jgi:hypothetical protein